MCATEKCLVDQNLLDELVQSQNDLDWMAGNYSQFWGRTLKEGQQGKLGTEFSPMQMAAIRFRYYEKDLPREFDSRSKWPELGQPRWSHRY